MSLVNSVQHDQRGLMLVIFELFSSGILRAEGVGACGHIFYSLYTGLVTTIYTVPCARRS